MSVRRLYLDVSPGESRGVVTLDGLPERLMIERLGVDRGPRVGARYLARVAEIVAGQRLAFLDLGSGQSAVLPLKPNANVVRGSTLRIEVVAEARSDKAATVRVLTAGEGKPGLSQAAPYLGQRLQMAAPGVTVELGLAAREAADEAEDAALSSRHDLGEGLTVTIEPTRAVVAVDVDWAPIGQGSAKRSLDANLRAVREAARLLRLKSLGGTVVIDLAGFPREGEAIQAEARAAFAPEQPGVAVLPVSRLGLLQVGLPRRERPVAELMAGPDGRLSARSVAQALVRALEREGRSDPGARLVAACSSEVAIEAAPLAAELGPRFSVAAELGWDRLKTDIRTT